MGRGDTFWGAYSKDLDTEIKNIVKKLEEIGVPTPTKLEASKLIAYRMKNGISFMNEKQIKEWIMKERGYSI